MSNSNNKPVHEVRDGSLRIAIFRNDPKEQDQRPRYSGKLTRSYRDAQGEWHDTEYLSGTEYLRAARLMLQAYDAELAQRAADSHEGPEPHA
jgi:hypothetical protein